jgi:hypothetical protein
MNTLPTECGLKGYSYKARSWNRSFIARQPSKCPYPFAAKPLPQIRESIHHFFTNDARMSTILDATQIQESSAAGGRLLGHPLRSLFDTEQLDGPE